MSKQLTLEGFPVKVATTFRTIHYLGSKLRILEEIKKIVDEIDANKENGICDLFAGSGVVSKYFALERKVISVDIQYYSTVILNALLNPNDYDKIPVFFKNIDIENEYSAYEKVFKPLIDFENELINGDLSSNLELVCNFLENASLYVAINESIDECSPILKQTFQSVITNINEAKNLSFIATKYFGGIYFSYKQSIYFDILLNHIKKNNKDTYYTLLAALLSTASDLVNTVGKQFAQPIRPRDKNGKPKNGIIKQLRKDRNLDVVSYFEEWLLKYTNVHKFDFENKILQLDYKEALNNLDDDVKIIYADPPYTREHYSRFYHGLETLALMDNPKISTTTIGKETKLSRGLYREERTQSDFSIISKAPKAFEDLFRMAAEKQKILLVSYSPYDKTKKAHPRVVELDFLENLAKKYFKSVEIRSLGKFAHSKLNKTELHLQAEKAAEVLIICKN